MAPEAEPTRVSGYFAGDLYNFGANRSVQGQKAEARYETRVVRSTRDGDLIAWRVILSDARGGLNADVGDFKDLFDRVSSGDAETRYPRRLSLPHLTSTQTDPIPAASFVGMHSVMFNDLLHITTGSASPQTYDFITSAGQQAAAQVYRITDWHGTTAPEVGTAATGTDDSPNPPDLNPGAWGTEKTLWIAAFGADEDATSMTVPSGFTSGEYGHSTTSGGATLGTAYIEEEAASKNPGVFVMSGGAEDWVAQTVGVRPASTGASSPTVESVTEESHSSSTSHAVDMPSTVNAGDLLLVLICFNSTAIITTPSGWTVLDSLSSTIRMRVYAKVADGTEDSTTVDFVTASANTAVSLTYRISGWYGTDVASNLYSDNALDTSVLYDINPPSITPSTWDASATNTLWIACGAISENTTVSGYPSGYSDGHDLSNTSGQDITIVSAYKVAAAASENPASFNISGGGTGPAAMAFTIAVRAEVVTSDYPNVASITETLFTTDTTAHEVAIPGCSSGDLLICFFANDADSTVTTPSGWTALHTTAVGTAARLSTYYRIADGTETSNGALFQETSTSNPTLVLSSYDPNDTVTGLDLVTLGGATAAQRLLVSRLNEPMQLIGTDYAVAGTLHTDTDPGWGAIQTFVNDDLILLYANGAIRYLAKTAAITDQPSTGISNVPNGGYPLGMVKLGNAPLRALWVWPFEDTPGGMLTLGTESPGHVISVNAEASEFFEVPVGLREVYHAVSVDGAAIAASDRKRITYYDGRGPARDLGWLSGRTIEDGYTLSCRGLAVNGKELWVRVEQVAQSGGTSDTKMWFEVYDLENNAWHRTSATKTIADDGVQTPLPSGSMPLSLSTRHLHVFSGDRWHRIYVPPPGDLPTYDTESFKAYEASATYTSPRWELPGLEGWPKVISRILFLGNLDEGGTTSTAAALTVTAGGVSASFVTGHEHRAQLTEFPDNLNLFYQLQVSAAFSRTSSSTAYTPNVFPIAIEGYCWVGVTEAPKDWMEDVR